MVEHWFSFLFHFYFFFFILSNEVSPINLNSMQNNLLAESDLCNNWNSTRIDCFRVNRTIQCNGSVNKLSQFKEHSIRKTQRIIFCSWPNTTFDPVILTKFSRLKFLYFEYGQLVRIANNFPKLKHLQVRIK